MKLLVFAGSTRTASWNRKLARIVAHMARASGAEVTHLELADYDIPMYNADLEAVGTPPGVMRLKHVMHEHAAWIICTPEYNASYPALLKNTLDWVSSPVKSDPVWNDDFRATRGKIVGVLSASPGALGGLRSQSHLVPLLFNLRTDPFERARITSNTYYDWLFDSDYLMFAAQALMAQFLETFEEWPPRQKAASFNISQTMAKLEAFLGSAD